MQMQIDSSSRIPLLAEIATVFPPEDMPRAEDLTVHQDGCSACNCLRQDLEEVRGKLIAGAVIQLVHQDLACLSTKALQWILPHYLRYCLSDEGQQSRMETEFLVYNFSPTEKFRGKALQRFAFLGKGQIECLIHFLDWCSAHPHWREYFPEDLQRAQEFLAALLPTAWKGSE